MGDEDNVKDCHVMNKSHTNRSDTWFSFRYKKTTLDSGGFYIFEAKNAQYDKKGNLCKNKNRLVSTLLELECWVQNTGKMYVVLGALVIGGLIILLLALHFY